MIASELIEKLQAIVAEHGDVPIVVTGFDSSGYDDPDTPKVVGVQKIANRSSHGPLYEDPDDSGFRYPVGAPHHARDGKPFNAIYIG